MKKKILDRFGISNFTDLKKLILQFLKFGIVGISNTLVYMLIYYIFLWINEDYYFLGSVVGTIISIANAFYWNNRFVFKNENNTRKDIIKRICKTYISYGGTSLLSNLLLIIEVSLFNISKVVAPIINLIITIPLNFIINKLWTFGK